MIIDYTMIIDYIYVVFDIQQIFFLAFTNASNTKCEKACGDKRISCLNQDYLCLEMTVLHCIVLVLSHGYLCGSSDLLCPRFLCSNRTLMSKCIK